MTGRRFSAHACGGFTLIELLVVVAIIAIITAIAVPAFLGQRERTKVRAVEASARSSVAEVQALVDCLESGKPYILLDANGTESCFEQTTPASQDTCSATFNVAAAGAFSDIGDIIDSYIAHHRGRRDMNPYDASRYLFVRDTPAEGSVTISNTSDRSLRIAAYASSSQTAIFNALVTAR